MINWGGSQERKVGLILINQYNCLTNKKTILLSTKWRRKVI